MRSLGAWSEGLGVPAYVRQLEKCPFPPAPLAKRCPALESRAPNTFNPRSETVPKPQPPYFTLNDLPLSRLLLALSPEPSTVSPSKGTW